MKPLSDTREWPTLAVMDIEAERWVDVTLVCHVSEDGTRKAFHDVPSYLTWLFSTDCGHVWAHWGGHYDFRFVISEATDRGWNWETVQSGGQIVVLSVTSKGEHRRTIKFCDSARLMPDSVERIGKTVGLAKLDVDRAHIEKLTLAEAVRYCYRDCDIVLAGLSLMRQVLTEAGADFAYTLASIATRYVRRSGVLQWDRFFEPSGGTLVYREEVRAGDDFCLPGYFGGRVEVFRAGPNRGPLFYYDIRSSYPWSMTQPLPAYFRGILEPCKSVRKSLQRFGISEATVTVPESVYLPVLPVREKGKLLFPVGTFRGRWTNLELRAAIEQGAEVTLHAQAVYSARPFMAPFVKRFYGLRQNAIDRGDKMRAYTYKILLNSSYGKLVESVERTSTIHGRGAFRRAESVHGLGAIEPTHYPGIYTVHTSEEGPFRHVAAGAYVTARSRLLLHAGLERAMRAGARVYYCDTDSIVTDKRLDGEIDELGHFKLEHVLSEFEAVAPKVYRAVTTTGEHIFRVKGVPVRGIDTAESERRWRDYVEGIGSSKEGITGFAADLRAGRVAPRATVLTRALRNSDSKRTHLDGDSRPLHISVG